MKNMGYLKFIKFVFIGIVLSLITSCEGGLEQETFDKLSPDNYPQNEEDALSLITGVYSNVMFQYDRGWNARGPLMINNITTDEFDCGWRNITWEIYRKFLWTANTSYTTDVYTRFVKAMSNCVGASAMIDQIEMNEDIKANYKAELKAMMALVGYTLYDFYGPTAIVTDPEIVSNPISDFAPERPTKEWMINFIKENGRESADVLPIEYDSSDYGRVTKGFALMVLLKLAMHEKDWNEANLISKEIMDLDQYKLESNYLKTFAVYKEMNDEIIYAIPRTVSDVEANWWLAMVLPPEYIEPNGIPVQKWGGYKVPWDMYDKFEEGNDTRLESLWSSINTRKGIVDIRTVPEYASWAQYGAIPYKYPADRYSTGAQHGNDVIIYRYADVLLLRAEALNNLNGPNQESIDLINMIRNRAKTSLIELSQFSDKQSLNDYILDERFRELFLEGHRRQDLIRHGKYLSEAARRGAPAYDEHFLLFPIPQSALDENSKIQQNAGY